MAVALIGQAALGAAFGEIFAVFYKTVKNVTNDTLRFDSILEDLKSTLAELEPYVEEIKQSNRELGRPEEEIKGLIEKMKKGEKLIRTYSKLPWLKYCMRFHYAKKLRKLEEALLKFFHVHVTAWSARTVLQTLQGVNDIRVQMNLVGMSGVGLSCAVPRPPDFIVGLDVPLKEVKMQLLEEVSLLLLTAPGGCGKTTLVKMLCQDEEIKGIFEDNIFFVPVSKTPNLKVIVHRVFRHKVDRVPEFQSDEDAINQLQQLLTQIKAPILLILDDVWSGSESLLENFKFQISNYKILVTSRTAFPRLSSKYTLKPLNDTDSMTLFRHSAILLDGSSCIPDEDIIQKMQIVKCCAGFPLALDVIGRSLCGMSAVTWRKRVKDWSSGHSILDSDSSLLGCLKRSLEFSDDEIIRKQEIILKECFLDLGSFPEDKRISLIPLIDMWAELYELDEDDSIANLLELIARNLASLEDVPWKHASDFASCYSEDFISQHDLLRELAIHQSNLEPVEQRKRLIVDISRNNFPKWWIERNLKPINARLMSISTDEMFSPTWFNIQPLEVEVLVLNFQTKNYAFPDFVRKMNKLRVLIVTNCGFSHAELGNFHLPGSVPCLKRIVLENVSVPSLCKSLEQLRSLEKISLLMCNIGQAFKSIQVSNALPNLVEINIDLCEDIAEFLVDLCDIICLKKLSITNCYKFSVLPQGIGKLVNLEVLRLRACINLLTLPESIRSLHNLTIFDTSYCLKMTWFPEHIGEFFKLEELHMEECLLLSNHLYQQWSNQLPPLFQNLKQLKLVTCDEEMSNLWEPVKEFHTSVKVKVIRSSGLIIRRVGLIFAGTATESTSLYGHNSIY
ncbi:hypothetical protein I3842_02G011400 [Carya illinoinensis]|uniref:RPW8 domain-containing protein n=2 Tax=Carya illinoinensis TaxID=32201 RepID=A0A922FR14_CARIL|nr:hypothetical protein I3842_02G011400 [Carya illinoinensis]